VNSVNKKLSYGRETARQLHMTIYLGWSADLLMIDHTWRFSAQNTAESQRWCYFFDIQTLWFKKCWPKTDFDM